MRIVYDASARENNHSPSLNDCLHVGPPLQPLLHDVLVRNRLKPIALTADVKQAFYQIWIDPKDRDAFRFYWISDLDEKSLVTLRLTRVPFGSGPSPFILGATLEEHLKNSEEEYPETVAELKKNVYVDDVISGGENEEQLRKFREEALALFKAWGFTLHKWHSTIATLEDQNQPDGYQTYAKEALGTTPLESKLLGLHWNKTVDTLAVNFEECKKTNELTKRGVLRAMAKVYDPLGIASPIMLNANHIYQQICEENHSWDGALRKEIELAWKQWPYNLPNEVTVPRSLTSVHEKITGVYLHAFGDAGKKGCCAAIYAVVQQGDKQVQGLLASKYRIAKKNTSIPRLELVSAHMAVNLVDNIRTALAGYNIIGT